MTTEPGARALAGRDIGSPSSIDSLVTSIDSIDLSVINEPIAERREAARERLSYLFAAFFAVTLLGAGTAAIIGDASWANAKEFLQILLPAELTLLGGAVGFYFGTQQAANTQQSSKEAANTQQSSNGGR